MDKKAFISLIAPGAVEAFKKYKVLPSLTIAQAILESAWGASGLSKQANNLFGIKWTEGCGYDKSLWLTKEFVNGKWVSVKAPFRKYKSFAESIVDHAKLLTKTRYKPVISSKDYKEACLQIRKCGYATDPNYTKLLIDIVEDNKLYEYDKEVVKVNYTQALQVLSKAGIDPSYWANKKGIDKNFEQFVIKIATYIKGVK